MAIAETHTPMESADNTVKDVSVSPPNESRQEIGRGRSGIVYYEEKAVGRALACKVFDSSGLTKIVQWLTLGAPNPYMWNADAVQCAKIRRDILNILVPVWTNGEVAVAGARAAIWNDKLSTFELQTRFVRGRAARLYHSLRNEPEDEAARLWERTMPDLRSHLDKAGFDGLLWQAGIGNPVALNNFLFEHTAQEKKTVSPTETDGRWVWIDLESGVPAIFPISPKVLLQFSLSHWWRRGRALFDDVDIDRLNLYLRANEKELRLALGEGVYETVNFKVARLGEHQRRWKSLGRLQSSIQYRLIRGDITEIQAEYYAKRRFRWALNEVGRGSKAFMLTSSDALLTVWRRLLKVDPLKLAHCGWRFLVSQQYREDFVHGHLDKRITAWIERGQLSDRHARRLRAQINSRDSSIYITDFGVHIAIKPGVKLIQYWVFPAMFALGLLGGPATAVLILTGGALGRTAYTGWRLMQSAARGCERPWVALWVGILPVVGNLAFPIQMLYSIRDDDEKLARFMLDDAFARLGRHFPVWGGEDTWTEHVFNRIPNRIARYRSHRPQLNVDEAAN